MLEWISFILLISGGVVWGLIGITLVVLGAYKYQDWRWSKVHARPHGPHINEDDYWWD